MAARHKAALDIQHGACNPRAIMNAMRRDVDELDVEAGSQPVGHGVARQPGADTPTICNDPAVRLMVHQLAHLMKLSDLDLLSYEAAVDDCRGRAAADKVAPGRLTLHQLDLHDNVEIAPGLFEARDAQNALRWHDGTYFRGYTNALPTKRWPHGHRFTIWSADRRVRRTLATQALCEAAARRAILKLQTERKLP